jgi:16S rRNA (guanine527-N7)-methyltransferase
MAAETIIEKYFPTISEKQIMQFNELQKLYEFWNSRINVISRKDIDLLFERHILHSLTIAHYFNFPNKCKILDIGTGGGFPGIPLAIIFPQVNFVLADSIGKKITVVNEIASGIKLTNVKAVHSRAENVDGKFHFVVSRAVAEFSQLVAWSANKIEKSNITEFSNGIICLKGGDLTDELKNFKKAQVFELSKTFNEEFFETKKIVYLPF